jgi:hypothetical protein
MFGFADLPIFEQAPRSGIIGVIDVFGIGLAIDQAPMPCAVTYQAILQCESCHLQRFGKLPIGFPPVYAEVAFFPIQCETHGYTLRPLVFFLGT